MEVNIGVIEKSNVMEEHYSQSIDPWGNRKRQLYQKILKYGSEKLFDYYKLYEMNQYPHDKSDNYLGPKNHVYCYDVGAGGGNVIDTLIMNTPKDLTIHLSGCDISESALNYLNNSYNGFDKNFHYMDCEEYSFDKPNNYLQKADIVTLVDVMYYWGNKRDYRLTLDEIWKTIKRGAIILVADSIIPYQRRSYFKSKSDCKVLEEYTDYTIPASSFHNSNKSRYLKVKIYQKI